MKINDLGNMVPGTEIDFSHDFAGMIPPAASMTGAVVTMRSGLDSVTATFTSISGTLAYFRVAAVKKGPASFDVVASFNNGREDGERFSVRVL